MYTIDFNRPIKIHFMGIGGISMSGLAEILLKAIVKLCKELSEFALDISSVVFLPKFVMVDSDGEEVKFIYSFRENKSENEEINRFMKEGFFYE